MHQGNFNLDISLEEISKIEGAASLDIKIRNNKIEDLKFSIAEWKRFYTQAIKNKPVMAIPQLVSRICGTCSNAHLLVNIQAIEDALKITPSEQTKLLRKLFYYALIIRDHALHLYVFSLPDIFKKGSILDFDENDPVQHELLHDTFAVKEVGNQLAILTGGRSVHAPMPTINGFLRLPKIEDLKKLIPALQTIRPKVLKLIKIFAQVPFDYTLKTPVVQMALVSQDFSFLDGIIKTSNGLEIKKESFHEYLDAVIIPCSHARGFKLKCDLMVVGALPRLNLGREYLHPKTKETTAPYLKLFPSKNFYHNNVAQAIEIIHAIDHSIEIIENLKEIKSEIPQRPVAVESVGVGVIEAPRGTLYHKLEIGSNGLIKKGEIIVPTGQNQIVMEKGIYELVERMLEKGQPTREEIINEVENYIRAFDPCMSCASHFLKVNWQ